MPSWKKGQANAAANGYVPLPQQIQQLAHTMLQQITRPNGQPAGLTNPRERTGRVVATAGRVAAVRPGGAGRGRP